MEKCETATTIKEKRIRKNPKGRSKAYEKWWLRCCGGIMVSCGLLQVLAASISTSRNEQQALWQASGSGQKVEQLCTLKCGELGLCSLHFCFWWEKCFWWQKQRQMGNSSVPGSFIARYLERVVCAHWFSRIGPLNSFQSALYSAQLLSGYPGLPYVKFSSVLRHLL